MLALGRTSPFLGWNCRGHLEIAVKLSLCYYFLALSLLQQNLRVPESVHGLVQDLHARMRQWSVCQLLASLFESSSSDQHTVWYPQQNVGTEPGPPI